MKAGKRKSIGYAVYRRGRDGLAKRRTHIINFKQTDAKQIGANVVSVEYKKLEQE